MGQETTTVDVVDLWQDSIISTATTATAVASRSNRTVVNDNTIHCITPLLRSILYPRLYIPCYPLSAACPHDGTQTVLSRLRLFVQPIAQTPLIQPH
jgi:hypothetical protein